MTSEQRIAAMRERAKWRSLHSTPSAERQWFSYDPDDGFLFFSSEEEARAHAAEQIPEHLDDGWSEEVEQICIGRVSAVATQVNVRQRPPDEELDEYGIDESGQHWDPDWDYCCDYKLMPPADGGGE